MPTGSTSAKLKLWSSIELNNNIYVWYHADNHEPSWKPEKVEEIIKNGWVYRGRLEFVINCYPQVNMAGYKLKVQLQDNFQNRGIQI